MGSNASIGSKIKMSCASSMDTKWHSANGMKKKHMISDGVSSIFPGRDKYILEPGAVVMDVCPVRGETSTGTLLLFCALDTEYLTISYRDLSGTIFAKRYTDDEIDAVRISIADRFPWGPFFKSLASDVLKKKATIQAPTSQQRCVTFTIVNSKEPGVQHPLSCSLDRIGSDQMTTFEYFVEPMTRLVQLSRRESDESHNLKLEKLECDLVVQAAASRRYRQKALELLASIRPLREEAAKAAATTMELAREVKTLERQIRMLKEPLDRHPLDLLYDRGGAQHFEHMALAEEHYPFEEEDVDYVILQCIREAFPLKPGESVENIVSVLNGANLQDKLSGCRHHVQEIFEIFRGIDRWDYDVIQLEVLTNGNALFYTTYALLYKLDLVAHFRLDDKVVQRFLLAVQAGYHPNAYHNAMHAADVTQINYYIMVLAGLQEKCNLSKEELLAGLLAGAIHDFDHPGLNNNFHTKTNAYLSTLYNDRSVLENHHVASVFELIRKPQYNMFSPLSEEQMRVVRETMIEMVLATDMGNHGKIFKNFQVRMAGSTDWSSDKESVRLALSMSIKMADISNCARPHYIYAEWAQNIAREFYNQGDVETKCNLPISPFMDRSKEAVEFPKGQTSFMMYIVIPMVEALSEFLPALRFALQHCNCNKEVWQNYLESH